MTYKQYIDNPMGKRNAVFSQRDIYRKIYTDKFDKLYLREAGKLNFKLYIDKATDRFIAHIKIPSETCKNFYYDAVILFFSNDPAAKSSSSLQNYNVKFFSNDPAFVFTYLNVFLKNDMFFEDMKPKSPKLALTEKPKITNPYGVPGYSKILYFAYLFIMQKNLFAKHMFLSLASPYNVKTLLNNVEHADKKIADRQEAGANVRREKALEKDNDEKHDKAQSSRRMDDTNNFLVKKTKSTPFANKTKTVARTGTSRITKRSVNKK